MIEHQFRCKFFLQDLPSRVFDVVTINYQYYLVKMSVNKNIIYVKKTSTQSLDMLRH